MNAAFSTSPDGVRWDIPSPAAMESHWRNISTAASGRRVVVVQGLGFVGAAVATTIAAAKDTGGCPLYFVIGIDLPTPSAWWKVATINSGRSPFAASDPEFSRLLQEAVDYKATAKGMFLKRISLFQLNWKNMLLRGILHC